ncbi:MAG TPA: asparagine synthase (glutamine-hydrolyzing), partial [Candidatus Methanoperedens sp.]|nr:asparagine synthase (glutamine-hydrolyzing) [Candidatus Methanoperedens sp.]
MCGIAGYAPLDAAMPLTAAPLGPMLAALQHRGPDDEGVFCNSRVALGHRRLAIVDLEGGHQPVAGARPGTVAVLNGEIYNYAALAKELAARGHRFRTRSDGEVLAHAYDAWGLDFLDRLDGMFALAVWDDERGRLLLARDRMGEKPLFHAVAGGLLLFASELTSLLAHPAAPTGLDLDAFAAYLLLEYVPAPLSLVPGVAKLPPGGALLLEGGTTKAWRYWRLRSAHAPRPAAAKPAELRELLVRSVHERQRCEVPLGVFVSGGIDSGAVAALAAPDTLVAAFAAGFEDEEFDERRHARAVATRLGIPLLERIVTGRDALEIATRLPLILDEPIGDASIIPTTALCAFAREHVKVALCGEGGDELFAGYPMHRAHRVARWARLLPGGIHRLLAAAAALLPPRHGDFDPAFKVRSFLRGAGLAPPLNHVLWMSSFSQEEQARLLRPEVFAASGGCRAALALIDEAWEGLGPSGPVGRSARFDAVTFLANSVLTKVDRASMSVGLEVRSPFLARDVVDFALGLADAELMRGLTGKRILRRALRDDLPGPILRRPKKG